MWNCTYAYVPQTSWETSFPGVAIGMSPPIHPADHMGYTSHTIPILPVVASVGFSSSGTYGTFPSHPRLSDFPLCALTPLHLLQLASSLKLVLVLIESDCLSLLLSQALVNEEWTFFHSWDEVPLPHGHFQIFTLFLLKHWLLISIIFYLLLFCAVIYRSSPPSLEMLAPGWWSAPGVRVC